MNKHISHIKQYILDGKLGLALQSIPLKRLSDGFKRDIAVLTYHFNSIKNDFHKGILTYEEYSTYRTKIADSLMSQIDIVIDDVVMGCRIKKMPVT